MINFLNLFRTIFRHHNLEDNTASLPLLPVSESHKIDDCIVSFVDPNAPTIFYDVDGVFHPYQTGSLEALRYLEFLCDEIPSLQLVMSSNWRENMDENSYKHEFSKKIVEHTVGFTPVMRSRQEEVVAFVNHFGLKYFLCIDDDESLFTPGWKFLYLTDRTTGMSKQDSFNILIHFSSYAVRPYHSLSPITGPHNA